MIVNLSFAIIMDLYFNNHLIILTLISKYIIIFSYFFFTYIFYNIMIDLTLYTGAKQFITVILPRGILGGNR
jgi:hypothetical protein